jgi:hypothetical protein
MDRGSNAAVADRLEKMLARGEPEQTKALLRIRVAELRGNGKTDISRCLPHRRARGLCNLRKKWAVQESNLQPWA